MFDPYRKWLGIPEDQRPPTHYQLLGISPEEKDIDVIETAVLRQSAFVRNFQSGQHAEDATRLLNEISAARLCLLDRQKRAKYDAELRGKEPARPAAAAPARRPETALPVLPVDEAPPRPAPAIDLEQLALPTPRRTAAGGRRLSSAPRTLGRPRSKQAPVGYVWQVPLLTVIIIILMLLARLIGRTIAEQRAVFPRASQSAHTTEPVEDRADQPSTTVRAE